MTQYLLAPGFESMIWPGPVFQNWIRPSDPRQTVCGRAVSPLGGRRSAAEGPPLQERRLGIATVVQPRRQPGFPGRTFGWHGRRRRPPLPGRRPPPPSCRSSGVVSLDPWSKLGLLTGVGRACASWGIWCLEALLGDSLVVFFLLLVSSVINWLI